MKRAAIVLAILAGGCVPTPTVPLETSSALTAPSTMPAPSDAAPATVLRILDGDSMMLDTAGIELEARLFGINTPERDECLGQDAREALLPLEGSPVSIVQVDFDQFDRAVVLVWSDGRLLNEAQVAAGRAVTLSGASTARPEVVETLIAAQERAAEMGLGLWSESACGATTPRPSIEVHMTSPNPPGPDDEVLDDEYVTVVNTGDTAIDLGGWTLRDESTTNRFEFPADLLLDAGDSIRIVTGCSAGSDLAWCADRSVWNNGGDSAFLLDDVGRIVATERYLP